MESFVNQFFTPFWGDVACGLFALAVLVYIGDSWRRIRVLWKGPRLKTMIGRLDFVARAIDAFPRHEFRDVHFTKDSTGQAVTVVTLRLGPDLRQSGLIGVGAWGTWFFQAQPSPQPDHYKTMRLYAYSDGLRIYRSFRDLTALVDHGCARPLLLGILSLMCLLCLAQSSLWPFGPEFPLLAVVLTVSLVLPLIWYLLERVACRKALTALDQQLQDYQQADLRRPRDLPWPSPTASASHTTPVSPPTERGPSLLDGAALFVPGLSWVVYFGYMVCFLLKSLKSMTSIFIIPHFETRTCSITAVGGVPAKMREGIVYPEVTLNLSPFGERKIARLRVPELLANNGCVQIGNPARWVMRATNIGFDRTPAQLDLAAVHDGKHLLFSPLGALYACGHSPLAPFSAAFWGLIAGLTGRYWFYGYNALEPGAQLLWLIPAAALPFALSILARRRILSAFQQELARSFPAAVSPSLEHL